MLRFFYILYLLIKYFFFLSLGKYKLKKINKPKLLRSFFEEASGSFIKFGQLLSMRVEMISNDYSFELLNLLDNLKPFSYKLVEKIFIEELGATPNKIFKTFESEPFASASFGQVHGAKLKDGTVVVVKVLRPGVESKAKIDFLVVDFLAFIADLFFKIEALPWKEFAKEFKQWTKQEFDYRIEASNGERLYNNNVKNSSIVIPKIYHHLTTKKILVEEYMEGLHLSRVLKRLRDGRLDEKKLKKLGIDLKKVPRILVSELLKQFFIDGFFHADPHPGNIILLQNGKIGLIDFGIVGGKDPMPNIDHFMKWAKATGDMNFEDAAFHAANYAGEDIKVMIRSALPATVDQKDIDEFTHLLADNYVQTAKHIITDNLENLKTLKRDYMTVFLQVIKAGNKYNGKVPKEFVILSRGLAVLGLMAKLMDSDFRITEELKSFFQTYPEVELLKNYVPPAIKRINREVAIERLTNWLSSLFEVDPQLYHLVQKYLRKYNIVET
ncbi:MAG: AarF/ABC1/UbiB kinase family protein [Candidatus Roizmanbacteria bacterium]|nr:MAG: AarF/ABC1/UbiB kinase family protein [Candidatus Roizmanbacteria bacterium]